MLLRQNLKKLSRMIVLEQKDLISLGSLKSQASKHESDDIHFLIQNHAAILGLGKNMDAFWVAQGTTNEG